MDAVARRRTFAIISHPDAGKTTLTEKLLLYGGAIELAGSVTARRQQRATASDWMEIERQRGISVSSTVLQFDHRGCRVNLLDTPGHRDFSEDTYRVLTAVDAALMVIDAGKGIEAQTRKLFDVCRARGVPIFTFMNKLDRPARDPLWLLDQLESVLGMRSYPMNWPLGSGLDFRGIFDRRARKLHAFQRAAAGERAVVEVHDGVAAGAALLAEGERARVEDELALLDAAGFSFDEAAVTAGTLTPVFFGSAVNNFGVELMLDAFVELAPAPGPRRAGERVVDPRDPRFSGFVFKIQANMDPKHRDRLAFVRVCSGRFTRDMEVTLTRTGERLRLSASHRVFGREREIVEEAWPGDVVGFVGKPGLRIGDTLADDPTLAFDPVPTFAPEVFAWIRGGASAQFKAFRKGLDQLLQEGVVQAFQIEGGRQLVPLLGAVGPLQFEVVVARLKSEYGVDAVVEPSPWPLLRWMGGDLPDPSALGNGSQVGTDAAGRPVVLFTDEWTPRYVLEKHPRLLLTTTPPASRPAPAAT